MKVDRTKLKKTPTEAPADCRALIEKLKACGDEQLLAELQHIKTWNIGKCELYHWVDLLDRFDGILADAGRTVENMSWLLACDRPDREQLKALLLAVLNFTALLIEYSFSRHLYSSIEITYTKRDLDQCRHLPQGEEEQARITHKSAIDTVLGWQ